ncbi:MAG: Rne/Rng family ribonuclease [Pseudomonadota bacterium]
MSSKMLIDATHREETRVVVKRANRVEEFDFETQAKKQLRGNIYLAKVTRVEPSLQAAFVDYGGNRHGFLAFSEIHPDYYQIPQADRDALLEYERQQQAEDEDASTAFSEIEEPEIDASPADEGGADEPADDNDHDDTEDLAEAAADEQDAAEEGAAEENATETGTDEPADDTVIELKADGIDDIELTSSDDIADQAAESVDDAGSDDVLEEVRPRRRNTRRNYKIQEVIKRRQIILVQVVKEERGNKGAALTTYLSLAGRYAVLMPNTPRGGGISRKITSASDRKRLKEVVSDLDVPDGMGVILRTAGANRTKTEIKRDFEYMMRLWETVRDLTLKSAAPMLVYEEGSLIKRSIRDLYSRDIDSVLVAGEDGYREAKDFMRMLMPSHAKNVQAYREPTPLFTAHGVEEALDTMFEPTVRLKSGGYLVINQTEALVAIDVNSGKSTREHNIEDTAVQTNLEAADEIARQLRLRDLAGLIVCDFIDMEEKRNNRAVEKRMKDALKADRARIQVGRISHFGLLEMSRQRIRTSLLESTMEPCPDCGGTGFIRTPSFVALQVLRQAESQLLKHTAHHAQVSLRSEIAVYVLNEKRDMLADLEARYGRRVHFSIDPSLAADAFTVSRGEAADPRDIKAIPTAAVQPMSVDYDDQEADAAAEAAEAAQLAEEVEGSDDANTGENGDGRRKRRRRRRRRNEDTEAETTEVADAAGDPEGATESVDAESADTDEEAEPKRKRRSRRGGRRRRGGRGAQSANGETAGEADDDVQASEELVGDAASAAQVEDSLADAEPSEGDAVEITLADKTDSAAEEVAAEDAGNAQTNGSAVAETQPAEKEPEPEPAPERQPEPVLESSQPEDEGPKRKGWWQRRSFF